MPELGEECMVGYIKIENFSCPFCDSKNASKDKCSLDVENDSAKLGRILGEGKRVGEIISHGVDGKIRVWIVEKYLFFPYSGESHVANNAHHVIPGNASFAKATKLHQFLAWKVSVTKKWYDSKNEESIGTERVGKNGCSKVVVKVLRMSKTGKSKVIEKKVITEGKLVYGLADYNINSLDNGAWLPSRNAIVGWSDHDFQWRKNYAEKAMIAHGYQFHDTHSPYSTSVLDELKSIEAELSKYMELCMFRCEDCEFNPMPTPKKIVSLLNNLSSLIKERKLKLKPGVKVEKIWATSSAYSADFLLPEVE